MASIIVPQRPPKNFTEQFAQIQASITERKKKDPVFNSLMEKNAEAIDALLRSIGNIFKKIKATPSTNELPKRFFQCSYLAAIVVPFDLKKNPLFKYATLF